MTIAAGFSLAILLDQPAPHLRICGSDIRGVRKASIAVRNDGRGRAKLAVRDAEGCARLADQLAGREARRRLRERTGREGKDRREKQPL